MSVAVLELDERSCAASEVTHNGRDVMLHGALISRPLRCLLDFFQLGPMHFVGGLIRFPQLGSLPPLLACVGRFPLF